MWSIISAAGWPIWPLIFGSVVALAIVFERIWALRKNQLLPGNLVADVCKTLPQFKDRQNIARLESHSALGGLMAAGLAAFYKNEDFEHAMQDKSIGVQNTLEKHLDVLSMIASAAPLMGLLGTVIGMIEIFAVQGSSAQTPEAIAAGIAVALYNTAFGLIVAIPAMVAYRLFKIRISNILDDMGEALKPFEDLLKQHVTNNHKAG
ncbi:MAG: MotA/TolQ/ExbB proton channel family protein [Gammaproteobacteria bacterium]|uniref:MotA/TolQ/ExbB proton channel family protein n=1 Tax=Limnobacter sp. TaxID=2003368 RepID=UPI001DDAB383|nr:MotA/TolQ/ExbB proton channel family protein [Limnobacter sp.]MBU0782482.1 MotA/TolQ/ExbB proton channel family protein [Gammaproteobacteria bacterium]MBU0850070.1 MotA/TolQ/ExbB proton channel family protein [Gammaproteobacteria bacterium]MBU1268558.1 MotA/TolQ/ExbB proton channel family protein [Gammaproteobacteria bacterium]MBU1528106.1 MotA/TolQ/ExbB proton channel family protein [Gammaproteobacteria bacterium]MBU1780959.1 MotA/TolQ/ExbB proton channel family protein [Gammaproteobacteri